MSRQLIRAKLKMRGFKVIYYGEYYYDRDRPLIPTRSGSYGLFYADTPQFVEQAVNIIDRLRQRLDNKRNKTGGYIRFGNYSWYVLNPKQIRNAEGMLIRLCGTPYNIISGERDDT